MIIGLTGTNGAGKNTIADYLISKWFTHFSVRDIIIQELKKEQREITRDSLINKGNELRQNFWPGYFAQELCKLAQKRGGNSVIESFRTLGEIEILKSFPDTYLRGIDADQKIRYERIINRNDKHSDTINRDEFLKQEEREYNNTDPNKANLKQCFALADRQFINNTSKEALYKEIELNFSFK